MDTLSYKTISANKATVTKEWVIVDATDQVLGRLGAKVAKLLRGKYKPNFTPHVDCGDNVIIINADKVKMTGKIFLLLSLRGLLVRVSLSSHFGGTIEEGIFFCMLCYAILCYAMCTKVHILTVLGEKCCIYRDNCCIFTFVQFFFFGGIQNGFRISL